MTRFFIIALLCLLACPSAQAAQKLFLSGPQSALQLLNPGDQPKTVKDYANIYYKNCVASNKDTALDSYIETQCGCTAAKFAEVMSFEQAEALFNPRNTDDYAYTRLMTLAYTPCLDASVRDYLYDNCLSGPEAAKIRNKNMVCSCISEHVAGDMAEYGMRVMPGRRGFGFDLHKTVDNPFPYLMDSQLADQSSQTFTPQCIQTKEYGW